jgi:hypothetical protein
MHDILIVTIWIEQIRNKAFYAFIVYIWGEYIMNNACCYKCAYTNIAD